MMRKKIDTKMKNIKQQTEKLENEPKKWFPCTNSHQRQSHRKTHVYVSETNRSAIHSLPKMGWPNLMIGCAFGMKKITPHVA